MLKGNLAKHGCVSKLSGKVLGGGTGIFLGPAKVFDSEDDAFIAVQVSVLCCMCDLV